MLEPITILAIMSPLLLVILVAGVAAVVVLVRSPKRDLHRNFKTLGEITETLVRKTPSVSVKLGSSTDTPEVETLGSEATHG